ncbi:MAG: EAL domain-containing protein [Gloeomargarita sp. HHBFW_bins_162]
MLTQPPSQETFLLVNEAGVVIVAQGIWRPLVGQEAMELLGQQWWDYLHPDDKGAMAEIWEQVLEHPLLPWQQECHLWAGQRQWRRVRLTLTNHLADPGVRAVVIEVQLLEEEALRSDPEITRVQGRQYDLTLALTREEFVLHYQPVVAVATGLPVGFEALVRWHHPIWGLLKPGEFIPLAEASGLIVPLGRWVLTQALQQLGRWQAQFPQMPPLRLHVNVAPVQLTHPHFVSDVVEAVWAAGVQPEQLVLEITEGLLVGGVAAVHDTLLRLGEFGVLVALDDFGTGYSSLGRLHDLPIQYLKIDRSFLLSTGSRAQTIVAAMVDLGASLGLTVVAEGVETEMQRLWLERLGCPLAQGYWFARPLTSEYAQLFLTQRC